MRSTTSALFGLKKEEFGIDLSKLSSEIYEEPFEPI